MKSIFITLLISLFASSVESKLIINTEEYAPLSYTDNGSLKGIATEQVEAILNIAQIDYEMRVFPWARSYNKALTEANTCVFTTSHTPERSELFKWVEPLSLNMSILVKSKEGRVTVNLLEDAMQYRIGIQNEDVSGTYLKSKGFISLDSAANADQAILKLLAGRVDMVALAESRYLTMVEQGQPIEKVLDIFALKMGLACNRQVDDETIEKLQKVLDKLIEEGIQDDLRAKYKNS